MEPLRSLQRVDCGLHPRFLVFDWDHDQAIRLPPSFVVKITGSWGSGANPSLAQLGLVSNGLSGKDVIRPNVAVPRSFPGFAGTVLRGKSLG